jgi:glycerate 2-kinase
VERLDSLFPGQNKQNNQNSEHTQNTQNTGRNRMNKQAAAGCTRKRVLIAPDKFKGSLTAAEVAESLARGLRHGRANQLDVDLCPVADGGDGTLDIAISAGFHRIEAGVEGPTGEAVRASYAEREGVALVELADASGIKRLGSSLAPLTASTYGTGQLIARAIAGGNRTVVLAIGGSATNDGGAGLVQALGAHLLDADGNELPRGGAELASVDRVQLDDMKALIDDVEFIIASDVDNPLLGPTGAATVFGPQKGASPEDISRLELGLSRWASVVTAATDKDSAQAPGAGAAGGVGFAGLSMLNATLTSGAGMVLDLVRFSERAHEACLVITGEGSLDEQTLHGKAPAVVASYAHKAGTPVVAVAGRCTLSEQNLAEARILRVYTLEALEPDLARSIANASQLLERLGEQVAERELA